MKHIFIYLFVTVYTFSFVTNINAQPVIVGTTTFDLQTKGVPSKLILAYPDGKVSTLWTGSHSPSYVAVDRGSYFNSYNGVSWGAFPIIREESTRSGYGNLINLGSYEIILSHDPANFDVNVLKNSAIGSNVFTPTAGNDVAKALYPSVACPEATDDIYVVGISNNTPQGLFFSRSFDGGNTWNILNYTLPGLDAAAGFDDLETNCAKIEVHGNDVYVLYGSYFHDLVLLHSPMQGNIGTWTKTVLLDFPIDNYSGKLGEKSDITGDGIGDKIITSDKRHTMIIGDDGTVHVWTGKAKLIDTDTAEGYNYFPESSGIFYWNSATGILKTINTLIDWDNTDGLNKPYEGIGAGTRLYDSLAFTSMVTAAIDDITNNIYLVYAMPIEYSDIYDDPNNSSAESFRDLFGIFSTDNGNTWSTPVNLTNSALLHTENIYPNAYQRIVNNKMHILWMQDGDPGGYHDQLSDPVHTNNIVYEAFDFADFGDTTPVCDIITPPAGLFAAPIGTTNAKLNWIAVPSAFQYHVQYFNVATPDIKLKKKSFTNSVNISGLTPGATYNFKVKTICPGGLMSPFSPSAFFTTLLREGSAEVQSLIFPNPANGVFTISASGLTDQPTTITIVNALGAVVYEQTFATDNKTLTTSIDISEQAAGLYFIQIVSGNVKDTGNLIIE